MSITASNAKPVTGSGLDSNPYITPTSAIRFGPNPFTHSIIDHDTTNTINTPPRPFEHQYTPTSSSPLAQPEMFDETEEPVLAELLPIHQQPTPQRLSYYNNGFGHSQSNSHLRSKSESAAPLPPTATPREQRRMRVENNRKKQFIDKIDQLDLSNIYGGTTLHHESPYDCVLPYRNNNAQAPVLAFQQSDEKNHNELRPSSQPSRRFNQDANPLSRSYNGENHNEVYRTYNNHRYTAYDPLQYMDSFLEGSTAYGVHPEDKEVIEKRGSRLRKKLSLRKKNKDGEYVEVEDDSNEKKPSSPTFSRASSSSGEETTKRYTGLIAPTQLFNRFRRASSESIFSNNTLQKHGRSTSESNLKSSQANNSPLQPIQPRSQQQPPLPVPAFDFSIQDENNNQLHESQPSTTPQSPKKPSSKNDQHFGEHLRPPSSKKKGNNRTSWMQRITSIGR
ncbi:5708_t:CDS:2 [Ambispora leptoticha]|uniref:5708_t:CDS:1 n=1 Tax=Ambispora leptoticha TaxID=144679 RepID=A0A9N9CB26_9GLOM|nr:5708_t:CDS:2 [Ambispora leptoticha]